MTRHIEFCYPKCRQLHWTWKLFLFFTSGVIKIVTIENRIEYYGYIEREYRKFRANIGFLSCWCLPQNPTPHFIVQNRLQTVFAISKHDWSCFYWVNSYIELARIMVVLLERGKVSFLSKFLLSNFLRHSTKPSTMREICNGTKFVVYFCISCPRLWRC